MERSSTRRDQEGTAAVGGPLPRRSGRQGADRDVDAVDDVAADLVAGLPELGGLAVALAGQVAGPLGELAGGAAAAPAQRRLPLGVDRGEDQPTEDADVLEELLLLAGLLGRVGLLPERVPGDGGRDDAR